MVILEEATFTGTEGAWVSAVVTVVTFSGALWADQFPAASLARTVMAYVVDAARPMMTFDVPATIPTDTPLRNTS